MKPLRGAWLLMLALALASAGALAAAPPPDPLFDQLAERLAQLAQNRALGDYALGEQARARDALVQLRAAVNAGDGGAQAYWSYVAQQRVALAAVSAQADQARAQLAALAQQREQIELQAKQRELDALRMQLAQSHLQNAAANEEAARLQAQGQDYAQQAQQAQQQAAQANKLAIMQSKAAALARREAQLAEQAIAAMQNRLDNLRPQQGPDGLQMTLEGDAFASGAATLKPQAASHLGTLVKFVQSHPNAPVRVIGYTDDTGTAAANLVLSRQRAQAVAQALEAQGVSADRIRTAGKGEADPIASNATSEGRARNRRVVVILQGVGG